LTSHRITYFIDINVYIQIGRCKWTIKKIFQEIGVKKNPVSNPEIQGINEKSSNPENSSERDPALHYEVAGGNLEITQGNQ